MLDSRRVGRNEGFKTHPPAQISIHTTVVCNVITNFIIKRTLISVASVMSRVTSVSWMLWHSFIVRLVPNLGLVALCKTLWIWVYHLCLSCVKIICLHVVLWNWFHLMWLIDLSYPIKHFRVLVDTLCGYNEYQFKYYW